MIFGNLTAKYAKYTNQNANIPFFSLILGISRLNTRTLRLGENVRHFCLELWTISQVEAAFNPASAGSA
jgi:hypothetical protein